MFMCFYNTQCRGGFFGGQRTAFILRGLWAYKRYCRIAVYAAVSIYLAFMVLCQDAYDNRSYVAEGTAANRVVCSILDMHARNLI